MIKNTTVLVTNRCNSRCTMCNIWRSGITERETTVQDFRKLFSKAEFRELEDLNISGGEPLIRKDIIEVIDAIIENMPKLHMFFLSTNGTNPKKARDVFKKFSKKIKDVYLCVSIEGDREINKIVRGIDSYDSALETIKLCREAVSDIHSIISMTLTPQNCNKKSLMHIKRIAEETGSTYSFRTAWKNDTYYQNIEKNLELSLTQKREAIDFMERYCMDDPFMRIQIHYFKTNKVPLMGDIHSGIKCHAGDIFVLVRPDGTIYPCINSSRKIGDIERGVFVKKIKDLGKYEQCPCCTECCIYPMLNWSQYCEK